MSQKNKRPATSQMNLLLRILIGGYLLYSSYDMRDHYGEPAFTVASIIFVIAGIWLISNSVKRMVKGDFDYLDSEGNIIEPDELSDLDELENELEELEKDMKNEK